MASHKRQFRSQDGVILTQGMIVWQLIFHNGRLWKPRRTKVLEIRHNYLVRLTTSHPNWIASFGDNRIFYSKAKAIKEAKKRRKTK